MKKIFNISLTSLILFSLFLSISLATNHNTQLSFLNSLSLKVYCLFHSNLEKCIQIKINHNFLNQSSSQSLNSVRTNFAGTQSLYSNLVDAVLLLQKQVSNLAAKTPQVISNISGGSVGAVGPAGPQGLKGDRGEKGDIGLAAPVSAASLQYVPVSSSGNVSAIALPSTNSLSFSTSSPRILPPSAMLYP